MIIFVYAVLCLIWGSTWIAIKLGLSDAPPLYSSGIRFAIAATFLYSVVLARKLQIPGKLSDILKLGYPGIFMFGASYAFVYSSELYISSALTAVLFASYPLFVAFLSIWILPDERLRPLGWTGLAMGLVGIIIISYDSLQTSDDIFLGTLLALCGSLVAAYGMLIHKQRFNKVNIFVSTSIQMTFGCIPLILAAFIFEDISQFQITTTSVGSILYLAVFGTIVAFLGYFWLLKKITAVSASLIALITPVVAIFIGVFFFSEALSVKIVIGTALILTGILLVNRKKL